MSQNKEKTSFLERENSIERSEIAERDVAQLYGERMLRLDLLFLDYLSECFVAVFAFVYGYC